MTCRFSKSKKKKKKKKVVVRLSGQEMLKGESIWYLELIINKDWENEKGVILEYILGPRENFVKLS